MIISISGLLIDDVVRMVKGDARWTPKRAIAWLICANETYRAFFNTLPIGSKNSLLQDIEVARRQ